MSHNQTDPQSSASRSLIQTQRWFSWLIYYFLLKLTYIHLYTNLQKSGFFSGTASDNSRPISDTLGTAIFLLALDTATDPVFVQ